MKSRTFASLIQGVSQQSIQMRRDAQAKEQINCFNSPVSGSEARKGFNITNFIAGPDVSSAFFHEFRHGSGEQYVIVLLNGNLKVYNVLTGLECAVAFPDGKSYLALTSGSPERNFAAVTVDDETVIGNKQVTISTGPTLAPVRPKEACFYFKAGAYKTKYTVCIGYNGYTYKWQYETPDNSTVGNAPYITTEQLAATFYRALTGNPANSGTVNASGGMMGGAYAGDTAVSTPSGAPTVGSMGFSCEIDGNVVRLWRTSDTTDFTISVSDGQGGKQLIGFQDSIENFADLPRNCFSGYVVKVNGEDKTKDDDYYVTFQGTTGSGGVWQECCKPGIKTTLDQNTMPWLLENTAPNTFNFRKISWSTRIAGDGDTTAPDPSFIGNRIVKLIYDRTRLGILWESGGVWSKGKKRIYTFFADTAQTALDTDPVDIDPSYSSTALISDFTVIGGARMLWAEKVQFLINTKQDSFKNTTVELDPVTNYEFSPEVSPLGIGTLLFFAINHKAFTTVRDIVFDSGKPGLDTTNTSHCPSYIPGYPRHHAGSDTMNTYMITTSASVNTLNLYQWLFTDQGRAQQAWSKWKFPSSCNLRWFGFDNSLLRMIIQLPTGIAIGTIDLSYLGTDAPLADRLRADLALNDTQCSVSYDASSNSSTITLPFPYASDARPDNVVCYLKADSGTNFAGQSFPVQSVSGNSVVVKGDLRSKSYVIGYRIRSERTFSEFLDKDQNGTPIAGMNCNLDRLYVSHGTTAYYRAEVCVRGFDRQVYEFEGRPPGDPHVAPAGVATDEGTFLVPISADARSTSITLINDSHLPSAWNAAQWFYTPVPALP